MIKFSQFFTEDPDRLEDNTINKLVDLGMMDHTDAAQCRWEAPDARCFGIYSDVIITALRGEYTHGTLRNYINRYSETPMDIVPQRVRGWYDITDDVSVSDNISDTPTVVYKVEGRLWTDKSVVSFWCSRAEFNSYSGIEHHMQALCQRLHVDFNELVWEFLDSSPSGDHVTRDLEIHLLPPEKKAQILKARGIMPKQPKDIKDTFYSDY
jgi:hypothetical protein